MAEMDAARGLVNVPAPTTAQDPLGAWHELDVPDPHVLGFQIHPPAFDLIADACAKLSSTMRTVVEVNQPSTF